MNRSQLESAAAAVTRSARPLLSRDSSEYDGLLDLIGDRRFVLIGDASHGTHEFYKERAEITKRLIVENGFNVVAVEADFPDASRVNCYVRGAGDDADAAQALSGFQRFPVWMWANTVMLDFVSWLRAHNDKQRSDLQKAAFYGLDLYSLHASIDAVVNYLEKTDPVAAKHARDRYGCFDEFGGDTEQYAYATAMGISQPCADEVIQQMLELNQRWAKSEIHGRIGEREALFIAEQNARIVVDTEEYYRTMFRSDVRSWNLRDRHMFDTINAIAEHRSDENSPAKMVVWAHNSHLGNASFTEMGRRGELNVGQLVRDKYRDDAFLLGFTTYTGTVTAAHDWGEEGRKRKVRRAIDGSVEKLFHDSGVDRFLLSLSDPDVAPSFDRDLLERAIGVIYRPATERQSHYFNVQLAGQFDAVIHIDETSALEPLKVTARWDEGEVMETYPSGM